MPDRWPLPCLKVLSAKLAEIMQVLGLNLKSSAFLSLLPWTVMAVGSSAAGGLELRDCEEHSCRHALELSQPSDACALAQAGWRMRW